AQQFIFLFYLYFLRGNVVTAVISCEYTKFAVSGGDVVAAVVSCEYTRLAVSGGDVVAAVISCEYTELMVSSESVDDDAVISNSSLEKFVFERTLVKGNMVCGLKQVDSY
ncbi:20175_t:CDS:2, partial [Cetraspora pellucida]